MDIIRVGIKSILSGGSAAIADLAMLAALVRVLHVRQSIAVSVAFAFGIGVNFCLQKLWAFDDRTLRGTHRQLGLFILFGLLNLGLNAAFMAFLVNIVHVWYLGAQCFTLGLLAVFNISIYRIVIFRSHED